MWWTLLVARFVDILIGVIHVLDTISTFPYPQSTPKWKLKGGYPCSWMILTTVMLHLQFVGVISGTYWNQAIFYESTLPKITLPPWFKNTDRKPPDPFSVLPSQPTLIKDCSQSIAPIIKPSRDVYFSYKTNVLYQSCQKNVHDSKRGALVDRGANGGLAGSDVRAIHVSSREVDVQGIDNHQLTNIPIVTAAGVVETQKGSIVLIMNQYAHV